MCLTYKSLWVFPTKKKKKKGAPFKGAAGRGKGVTGARRGGGEGGEETRREEGRTPD